MTKINKDLILNHNFITIITFLLCKELLKRTVSLVIYILIVNVLPTPDLDITDNVPPCMATI